jgi:guanine nucleotide-binding protein subunit alpha
MRLIYTKDGFSKNEKEEWRVIIFNNILDGLRMTTGAMKEFGINFEYESTKVSKSILEEYDPCAALTADISVQAHLPTIDQEKDLRPYEPIPIEYLQAFKDLWKDPGLQKAIERGNEFALHDNLS